MNLFLEVVAARVGWDHRECVTLTQVCFVHLFFISLLSPYWHLFHSKLVFYLQAFLIIRSSYEQSYDQTGQLPVATTLSTS